MQKKAFYNIISSLVLQSIMLITNFIVPHLIIHNYGSSINGLITSITQFLSFVVLLESGIGGVVLVKYYDALATNDSIKMSQVYKESKKFFDIIAYITIIYVIILCIIFPYIAKNNTSSRFTVTALILIISTTYLTQYFFGLVNQLVIQADQKAYIVNFTKGIANLISTILIALFIFLKADIILVKSAGAIALVSIPVVFSIYVKKNYNINPNIERNKSILSDKWNGLGQHIATFIHGNADIVLLTLFSGVLEVSVYSVYTLITSGMHSVQAALSNGVSAAFGNMIANGENKKVKKYYIAFDYLNMLIFSVLFTVTFFMILPFVRLYTNGATDINYIRPLYAAIVLVADYLYCVRCSYSCIIFAAGHFRQTMKNSYVEAGINIVISLLLVNKFGLVGVGIGTLAAMAFRSIDYIRYLSKNIIFWDIKKIAYKYIINIIAFTIVFLCVRGLKFDQINSIGQWIVYAVITTLITVTIYLTINFVLNKNEIITVYKLYVQPLISKVTRRLKKGEL